MTRAESGTSSPPPARTSCGWPADITEHWTGVGKLYLCAIKDIYSNRIVGYSIDSRKKSRLAVAALNHAVARRGDVAGCVLHTDRGSQFGAGSSSTRSTVTGWSVRWAASARHGDNAAMESFFSLLQKNVSWVERTYHRRRRQAALGRLTPVEYELIMTPTASQAA